LPTRVVGNACFGGDVADEAGARDPGCGHPEAPIALTLGEYTVAST
jgi:hypothetical protein